MPKPHLAIASGNKLGCLAAQKVARNGGNAVDAALASAIMGWVAEPFFASLGGSGFVVVRKPDGGVEVIDGNNMMPLTVPADPGQGMKRIFLPDYADGIYMGIGGGSVSVPGVLAAIHTAWKRHGRIEWEALFEDAIEVARKGFPFPKTSDYYLSCTWGEIWSRYEGARALFLVDDGPMRENDTLVQPELADTLEEIATKGCDAFYKGTIASDMADAIAADDGFLGLADLEAFEAEIRGPVSTNAFGWQIESNPPPAVGGAVLVHMLALLDGTDLTDPVERLRAVVEAQRAAVGYRRERYHDPLQIAAAFKEALDELGSRVRGPESTTHTSAADADGYACSLTESNGYGAGLVVRGVLLNNTLGEEELNPLGAHRLPPGSRTQSNMAPTIASANGSAVALGSPGADRIVGAITQTFLFLTVDGMSLQEAVAAPRAHLDPRPDGETLCFEPGLPGDQLPFVQRPYDEIHMYFGAVQAASVTDDGTVDAAHDPRRSGGSALV